MNAATRLTATVEVRIPDGGDADLATCACRRLEAAPAVEDVEALQLHGIDPGLSATVVTLEVAVDADGRDDRAVECQLADAPGAEAVEVRR